MAPPAHPSQEALAPSRPPTRTPGIMCGAPQGAPRKPRKAFLQSAAWISARLEKFRLGKSPPYESHALLKDGARPGIWLYVSETFQV